ncbi:MAG: beta-ketoacyl synthase chain length factor [Pseudomonadota bacterium]
MKVGVAGVGLIAPGLEGWQASVPVLAEQAPYTPSPFEPKAPAFCPPNERRRMTSVIRIALQAALEAMGDEHVDLPTVFASSEGDLGVIDHLCAALAEPHRPVSPTQFHNSVHNAPAGYWHLGRKSHAASTSLSAGEASFASGLMDAMSLVHTEGRSVLFVAYDGSSPERLRPLCPIDQPFACALVIQPWASNSGVPGLELGAITAEPPDTLAAAPALEDLRLANPSARALPLLCAMATRLKKSVRLPYLEGTSITLGVGV